MITLSQWQQIEFHAQPLAIFEAWVREWDMNYLISCLVLVMIELHDELFILQRTLIRRFKFSLFL